MVLSASPPADAPTHPVEGWIRRITRHLALTDRGILLLVDRGQPWRLDALLRHLVDVYGDIEVYTEVSAMATVPVGSTVVLVPRAEDAEALNMARSLFSRHELRVVLFCERPVSEALRRDAPDFFDWISLVVECPESHPPHIVNAINTAMSLGAPAIAWCSDAPDAMTTMQTVVDNVLQAREFSEIDLTSRFGSIIKAISRAKDTWLCAYAHQPLLLQRFRWALSAKTARNDRGAMIVVPERMRVMAYDAGFFPIHAAMLSMAEARRRLAAMSAKAPGRLATWLRCEPDAIELAVQLLSAGEDEGNLELAVRASHNPCGYLAMLALEKKISFDHSPIIRLYERVGAAETTGVPFRPWRLGLPPGPMALHAFESGDEDAGEYFAKRWLKTGGRRDIDMRARLAEWIDIKWHGDIERIRRTRISGPASMIPVDTMEMGTRVYLIEDPERPEQRILLTELVTNLTSKEQLLLKYYLADMDFAEIAAEMRMSTSAARRQFKRVVEKMRKLVGTE